MSDGPAYHSLKIWPDAFEAIIKREKTYELRNNDRMYRVGDGLELREWDPGRQDYTGRGAIVRITRRDSIAYLKRTYGLDDEAVILSFDPSTLTPDAPDDGYVGCGVVLGVVAILVGIGIFIGRLWFAFQHHQWYWR